MVPISHHGLQIFVGSQRQIMNRIIGEYIGEETGPLLIVIGAIHGNEPAGAKAIDLSLKMLEVEPIKNPDFKYKGYMLGLIGNLLAYKKSERFINKDLNRCWIKEDIAQLASKENLTEEDIEIKELLTIIHEHIKRLQPTEVVLLDLHTTSSDGGIFSIVGEDESSLQIAKQIYAPVILGMLKGLRGTTLHYFDESVLGVKTSAITFESGQHEDPLSVNRAIAAIITCMRTIGSVNPTDVENQHDNILIKYSESLPEVARLEYKHSIEPSDEFQMKAGYQNFQKVYRDEVLAKDKNGEITSQQEGMILMPLYQKKGEDGFFIISEIKN